MNTMGIRVIRFKNEEIENNCNEVVSKVKKELFITSFPLSNIREGVRG